VIAKLFVIPAVNSPWRSLNTKEDVLDNPVELRTALTAPHFDDRRVVLRAQRVVPLDLIRLRIRNRKLWFLTAAFAIAMMLGSASALVTVRIKQMRSAATQVTQAPGESTSEANVSEPETAEAIPLDASETPPAIEEEAPLVKRTVTPRKQQELPIIADRPRMVGPRPGEVAPSEDEQLQQIREAVLYDQWQERRMRRAAARRERRNRAGDRDLSHVDEIFEGQRRPERPY
jgi:hypothetical protein